MKVDVKATLIDNTHDENLKLSLVADEDSTISTMVLEENRLINLTNPASVDEVVVTISDTKVYEVTNVEKRQAFSATEYVYEVEEL